MLRESKAVVQNKGEPRRRWFFDDTFDLLVWFNERRSPVGYQLTYPTDDGERVLTLFPNGELNHNRVDEGASGLKHDMMPLLTRDGHFAIDRVLPEFYRRAEQLDFETFSIVVNGMKRLGKRTPSR